MSDQTFEAFMTRERDRIHKEKIALIEQRSRIERQIAELDREFKAIAAYESVKMGKPATQSASSGGGTRRTGQRDAVLKLIADHADGISPAMILEKMGATSDAEKTSVRNALSALKRNNSVATRDGNYFAA